MAVMQMRVSYFPGITVVGEQYALLEWSADNRIRLFAIDGATGASTGIIFDAALEQIEKVSGSMAMLTFKIAGKKYRIEASTASRMAIGTASAAGVVASAVATKNSGIYRWLQAFREKGVKVTYLTYRGIVGIALGVTALIVVGAVVYILVVES